MSQENRRRLWVGLQFEGKSSCLTQKAIGIDVGLKYFLADSRGRISLDAPNLR